MSASPEQFAAMLLAGFGGQPCRDAEQGAEGVWLPLQSWVALASIARNHDSAEDCIAYAALKAESLARGA